MTLGKDSGVISERTDIAVRVSLQLNPTATQGSDFSINMLDVIIPFEPSVQSVNLPINIIDDALPEVVESFILSVESANFGFGAERVDTFAETEVFITDNDSECLIVSFINVLVYNIVTL